MIGSIATERLILRQWKESDLFPFYRLNSDPEVMKFFPALLSREESDEFASEIRLRIEENGWGLWAVEERKSKKFIGFVGLNQPIIELPFSPCIEVGWRLAKEYWGKGYATEAGEKALEYAFVILAVNEVVSFTAAINSRSESVMQRLGLANSHSNFNHPAVPPHSQLCEHVLYKISLEQWQASDT